MGQFGGEGASVEDRLDHLGDWIADCVISRHIAASWRGSPGRTLPSSWSSLIAGGDRVDEDLLAGAQPLGM